MKRFQRNLASYLFFLLGATQLSTQGYAIGGGAGAPPPSSPPPPGAGTKGSSSTASTPDQLKNELLKFSTNIKSQNLSAKMQDALNILRSNFLAQTNKNFSRDCSEDNGENFATNPTSKGGQCLLRDNKDFVYKALKKGASHPASPIFCLAMAIMKAENLKGKRYQNDKGNTKVGLFQQISRKCLEQSEPSYVAWMTLLNGLPVSLS
jgi:hypothetical protein